MRDTGYGLLGFGIYFAADTHPDPKMVWRELAKLSRVPNGKQVIYSLTKMDIFVTKAGESKDDHWLITSHEPLKAKWGTSTRVSAMQMGEWARDGMVRMVELARMLGFDPTKDVGWHLTQVVTGQLSTGETT